jgi:membrane protein DedA with SNARE-associated domain
MGPLAIFVEHWGYAAVFAVIILGSVGLPVPEETILTLAGYLVWRGDLSLPLVVAVGVVSASLGDNLGY